MRQLILFLLGIAVGAAGTAVIAKALAGRDAYARGVMQVMQHHFGGLRESVRAGNCAGPAARAKPALAGLLPEMEPAFAPESEAAPFREYSEHLREAVAGLPDGPATCSQLAPAVAQIGNACDKCHAQYR